VQAEHQQCGTGDAARGDCAEQPWDFAQRYLTCVGSLVRAEAQSADEDSDGKTDPAAEIEQARHHERRQRAEQCFGKRRGRAE
jgi:hypothetical protein